MDTLLTKVEAVEEEAANLVARAEEAGQRDLAAVRSREAQALEEVRQAAHKKGEQIVQEKVSKAKDRINKIQDEEEAALSAVKSAAEKNREAAVEAAITMFKEEYL